MRLTRVFVDLPLAADSQLRLEGAAANHLTRVLRLEPGAELTVFDGRGGEYRARLQSLARDAATVAVGSHQPIERESPLEVTLAQGVSRGERMDLVVQKATELGVTAILPILAERTVVRMDPGQAQTRLRHWRAIAVSACEQCGRNRIPQIAPPQNLAAFLADLRSQQQAEGSRGPTYPARIVLSPQGALRMTELSAARSVLLLIGPEGGLADHELEAAVQAGFRASQLGPRVLRTETAAIAALSALQLQLGDF